MLISKNIKKLLISSAALLMLAGAGAVSSQSFNVNASHLHTHRIAHHHHSRKGLRIYYSKRYGHKLRAHKLNLRRINHMRKAHKYNTRRWNRTHKSKRTHSRMLGAVPAVNQYYKTGFTNATAFGKQSDSGKYQKGSIWLIRHLVNNNNYRSGWLKGDKPYTDDAKADLKMLIPSKDNSNFYPANSSNLAYYAGKIFLQHEEP